MSSKRWSYKVGETHSGDRVRVYERAGSNNLYIATWDPSIGGYRRRSLEHADRDRAKTEAEEASRELREARERSGAGMVHRGPATLAECIQEYMALKSPQHVEREQAADRRRAELWIRFAGGRTAAKLSNREWDRFVVERTSGAIDARGRVKAEASWRPVRDATARADLLWLRWVLNWCCNMNREDGSRLLEINPVPEPKSSAMPDREKNAKRPVMSAATFASLLEAARGMALDLLVLANGTGRRISAICELRWKDVNLEARTDAPFGSIRWPEDTDKEGRASTIEIDPDVRRALLRRHAKNSSSGSEAPVFKARRSEGSISRHYADSLLRKTAETAGVELREGEAWHSIRRKWVNDRKHLPPKDVAEAGGWSNVETMMQVYTQTDSETRLSVVLNGRDWTQSTGHSPEEESQEAA